MRVIATAGHVDHGKSSLVQALTGTDPDRFTEEQARGLTIDLGFAHLTLPSGAGMSFVDVPGHIRFVRNMLAGVGGVDGCVFVVDAVEAWKPQSEEHLRILEMVGVAHGIVAVTKADLVDDEWLEIAMLDITERVANTFLAGSPILAVDSLAGTGLDALVEALDELAAHTPGAVDRGRPRLWVDRAFSAKGAGTIVTGTLTGGSFSVDDTIVLQPHGSPCRVRGIQTLGREVSTIGPGNRVALNLGGVERNEVGRGDVVVTPDRWLLTDRFDASLNVLASLDHAVSRRGAFAAYIGAREVPVRLRVLGDEAIAAGTSGLVRLFAPVGLPLLPGDRFVLRESGRDETVGGGEILDIDPQLKASLARPDRSVERVVRERGWVTVDRLERLTGTRVDGVVGEWVTSPESLTACQADLRERVSAAGDVGLDLAVLTDRESAVIAEMTDVVCAGGYGRATAAPDPFADHPLATAIKVGGFTPPKPDDRGAARELTRRNVLVERDGVFFHRETIDAAAQVAARLLANTPDGFTVAAFRDATGASRKFVLPLVNELDARGITRRRDDVRIGGPRLPTLG